MSHSTVAHRWFHQTGNLRTSENSYSSGNMFYEGRIIYSYGYHFAIAVRFDDIVIFNCKEYSVSTSKHISHTRSAIDNSTHEVLYIPFEEQNRYSSVMRLNKDIDFKAIPAIIDYSWYVDRFEENLKKLGSARKPELYLNKIQDIKHNLEIIFKKFRGAKTQALKVKGVRAILKFEFTEATKTKLKKARQAELDKAKAKREAQKEEAFKNLLDYEAGKYLNWATLTTLGMNTVVRVVGGHIETSKGIKLNLEEGLRVFRLWKAGKGLGLEITTADNQKWTCTKVNGIIKFGCHEVQFEQANRVLTPYL